MGTGCNLIYPPPLQTVICWILASILGSWGALKAGPHVQHFVIAGQIIVTGPNIAAGPVIVAPPSPRDTDTRLSLP